MYILEGCIYCSHSNFVFDTPEFYGKLMNLVDVCQPPEIFRARIHQPEESIFVK